MIGIANIEKETINKKLLADALIISAKAIENLLVKGFAEGRIKGFKPYPASFSGYLISNKSHHRGQITLSLKFSGHPVDKKTQFRL